MGGGGHCSRLQYLRFPITVCFERSVKLRLRGFKLMALFPNCPPKLRMGLKSLQPSTVLHLHLHLHSLYFSALSPTHGLHHAVALDSSMSSILRDLGHYTYFSGLLLFGLAKACLALDLPLNQEEAILGRSYRHQRLWSLLKCFFL